MSVETHVQSHHEHPDVVGSRNRLGLILLLVADISFALAVLFVYFYLKGQNVNDMWLPKASDTQDATVPVSSMGAWSVTIIAALGLLFQRYALAGAKVKNQTQLVLGSGLALVAALAAFIYQIIQMNNASFTITMGAYASCYYRAPLVLHRFHFHWELESFETWTLRIRPLACRNRQRLVDVDDSLITVWSFCTLIYIN
jgi:heme/copper-type cytochrome/quinol oxidase subunit 3